MVPLSRAVGRKRALQMLLTGEPIDAATALDWGLVNQVVPAERARRGGRHAVGQILRFSPRVIGLGKRAFYDQVERSRIRRLRARAAGDGRQRGRRRRPGGHRRVPREATAGVAG